MKRETVITKDLAARKLNVVRLFDASLPQVWKAWSEAGILDQWWAPKPYRAETKSMDFSVGGYWLYAMKGPEGDVTWCRESYRDIQPQTLILNDTNFCDEDANLNFDFPTMHWTKGFSEADGVTTVAVEITFDSEADLDTIVKMGFQEGFNMGLNNLEEYLNAPGK